MNWLLKATIWSNENMKKKILQKYKVKYEYDKSIVKSYVG